MTTKDERQEPPLTIEGKRYYNATQAAHYLGVSLSLFYKRFHSHLKTEKPLNYKRHYYTEEELSRFKS